MYGKKGARRIRSRRQAELRANSMDMDNFGRVAKIFIDPKMPTRPTSPTAT
jgi:hypothetical protein